MTRAMALKLAAVRKAAKDTAAVVSANERMMGLSGVGNGFDTMNIGGFRNNFHLMETQAIGWVGAPEYTNTVSSKQTL